MCDAVYTIFMYDAVWTNSRDPFRLYKHKN